MSELIDNRARRIRTLNQVVRGLHEGQSLDVVRSRMESLVRECDAADIAAMEQELIGDGLPAAEVMKACDLHSQAVRGVLVDQSTQPVPAGHPVDTFRRENAALGEQVARVRDALAALGAGPAEEVVESERLEEPRRALGLLMDVDKHYLRKEHLLFPFLEKRGISGPSTVMWGKDDEVRALLRELDGALAAGEATAGEWALVARAVGEPALRAVEEMVFKEQHILLPVALQNLGEAEWAEVAAQSPGIGYCLVDPLEGWRPAEGPAPTGTDVATGHRRAEAIVFPTGSLSLEQLKGTLEVTQDLTRERALEGERRLLQYGT